MKVHETESLYYCRICEHLKKEKVCPRCGNTSCSRIPQNTANQWLWEENGKRMQAWIDRGRMIPEVE